MTIEGSITPIYRVVDSGAYRIPVAIDHSQSVVEIMTRLDTKQGSTAKHFTIEPRAQTTGDLSVRGRVIDASNNPINSAQVSIGESVALTDTNGVFQVSNLSAATDIVRVEAPGYLTRRDSLGGLSRSRGIERRVTIKLSKMGHSVAIPRGTKRIRPSPGVSLTFGNGGAARETSVAFTERPLLGNIYGADISPLFDLSPLHLGAGGKVRVSLDRLPLRRARRSAIVDAFRRMANESRTLSISLIDPALGTYRELHGRFNRESNVLTVPMSHIRGEEFVLGPFVIREYVTESDDTYELWEPGVEGIEKCSFQQESRSLRIPFTYVQETTGDAAVYGLLSYEGYSVEDVVDRVGAATGIDEATASIRIPAGMRLPERVWIRRHIQTRNWSFRLSSGAGVGHAIGKLSRNEMYAVDLVGDSTGEAIDFEAAVDCPDKSSRSSLVLGLDWDGHDARSPDDLLEIVPTRAGCFNRLCALMVEPVRGATRRLYHPGEFTFMDCPGVVPYLEPETLFTNSTGDTRLFRASIREPPLYHIQLWGTGRFGNDTDFYVCDGSDFPEVLEAYQDAYLAWSFYVAENNPVPVPPQPSNSIVLDSAFIDFSTFGLSDPERWEVEIVERYKYTIWDVIGDEVTDNGWTTRRARASVLTPVTNPSDNPSVDERPSP